jgi:hypothetical protein
MVMTSWSERHRRRGAIAMGVFLTTLDRAGFIEDDNPSRDCLHEFTHPDTPGRRYNLPMTGENYSHALPRLLAELEAARIKEHT